MNDYYNDYDEYKIDAIDRSKYAKHRDSLSDEEKRILSSDYNYYEVHFSNHGGLVMPLVLEFTYVDGSKEEIRIPAEIWRHTIQRRLVRFS